MDVLGIITARGNSKRIRNKNILPVNGTPVIVHTINAARSSRSMTRLICSTDSLPIASVVKKQGVEVIMRPARFASDHAPIEDALRHVLDTTLQQGCSMPDALVLLYANVPYRSRALIDGAVKLFCARKADAVVSVSPTERYHPERLVTIGADLTYMPYVSRLSTYRRQELSPVYFIDSGVIVLRPQLLYGKDPLIVSHYFKGHKVLAYISKEIGAWDIDIDFDIDIAKLFMSSKKNLRGRII
jgi:CMP-N,N'-diacetyllegionaminic acid synthase